MWLLKYCFEEVCTPFQMWRIPNYSLFINIANYAKALTVEGHAAVRMNISHAMCGNINNYGASILLIGQPYHYVLYHQNK